MGEVATAVGEIEQALASVKDDASSRAAQQKMKAIQPRLAQAVQAVVDLQGKGAVPANAAKFQADSTRVTITVQKFYPEIIRLMTMPSGMDLLEDVMKASSELQKLPGMNLQAMGLALPGLTPPATPPAQTRAARSCRQSVGAHPEADWAVSTQRKVPLECGGLPAPPTIFPTAPLGALVKREWIYPVYHANLGLVYFHALHQCTDDFATRDPFSIA